MGEIKKGQTQFKGPLMLLLTAFIWGVAFVAQSVGMESIGAFTFNCIRTIMGSLVLVPVILIRDHFAVKKLNAERRAEKKSADKRALFYGVILGCVFFVASNLQQFAFYDTTSGKIAFITALYIFFVPLFGLVLRKKTPWVTWICVALGFVGLFFLCVNPNELGVFNRGDLLAVLCSVFFAIHILLVDRFSQDADGLKLSCIQFAVAGVISGVMMLIFETPNFSAILTAAVPLLYAGICSCGLAYTFQIVGQKYTEATVASLLMCMESVFGVLAAAIILHEMLSGREIFGCAIMFVAIILSQLSGPLTEKVNAHRNQKKYSEC